MAKFQKAEVISVYVHAKEHANLDSFPLRYGFYFSENTVLELYNCRNWQKQEDNKHRFEAEFRDHNDEEQTGVFVGIDENKNFLKLATVIRSEISTEHQLSDHLKKLRKAGEITPDYLIRLHPYYMIGKANSVAGLIATIKQLEQEDANVRIDDEKQRADAAEQLVDKEKQRADDAEARAEAAEILYSENLEAQVIRIVEQMGIQGSAANPDQIVAQPIKAEARQLSKIERIDQALVKDKITKIYGPPGTGKTTTLINLVQKFIELGVSPNDIGFFAFTNFATSVAKQRIVDVFPNYDLNEDFNGFRTLHSLAYQMLPAKADILTPEQAREFDPEFSFEEVMLAENDPDSIVYRAKQVVVDAAAVARSRLESFETYLKGCNASDSYRLNKWLEYPTRERNRKIYERDIPKLLAYEAQFNAYKKSLGVIDYTDILELGCGQEKSVPTYKVIFIDEAQDLSNLQWALAEKLFLKADHIFLAGDDDQAICESFGASPEAFVNYESKSDEILSQSYRIPLNVHKSLFAEQGIIARLAEFFTRKDKDWHPRKAENELLDGLVVGLPMIDLLALIETFPQKEWLILGATHMTLQKVSKRLEDLRVPHILSNRIVVQTDSARLPTVKIATVWGAKGGETSISVLLRGDYIDETMFKADPRLIYVARTRTKAIHIEVREEFPSRLDAVVGYVAAQNDVFRPKQVSVETEHQEPFQPKEASLETQYQDPFQTDSGDTTQSAYQEYLDSTTHSELVEKTSINTSEKTHDPDLEELKCQLRRLNKRSDEFDKYKQHSAVLKQVIWSYRGPKRSVELIMDDGSRRAKLWDLEATFEVMTKLRGRRLVTAPVNPSRNSPLEWFNDVYIDGDEINTQYLGQQFDDGIPF